MHARNCALDARRTEPGDVRARLTTEALAGIIRKTPATIRRWCRDGKIPHVKIGGEYVFDYVEVFEHFAKENAIAELNRITSNTNAPLAIRQNAQEMVNGLRDGWLSLEQLAEINSIANARAAGMASDL